MIEKQKTLEKKLRILIVEDHTALAENLFEFLGEQNYILDFAADGLTGLHLAAINHYDVIVLDVMLPGMDGFTLCQRLREDLKSDVPVILMTAKGTIGDKETGFEQGADDYITKPFDLKELELRIGALSRRNRPAHSELRAGDIFFSPGTLMVKTTGGHSLKLTGIGASIFELLIRSYPNYVSHQRLIEKIWDDDLDDIHTLRSHISSLRSKLKREIGSSLIKSVHGKGYCLDPESVED